LTRFDLETWDSGGIVVNKAFADLFRRHDWSTFATIWSQTADAAVAKKLRADRITLRFTLNDEGIERPFYIKRHARSSWKEYVKPLLRLTWPILGARNEWNAILDFHEAGLPTMTPVAFGESGSNSFLITEALENCTKLSDLGIGRNSTVSSSEEERSELIREVARIAHTMHRHGLHHQDFYLGHLLLSSSSPGRIYVIDLGRVRKQKPLSRRWIIKDLAQLNFSAALTPQERLQFLHAYLGRRLTAADRLFVARIDAKTETIARHSRKNRL
jgi:heptose I phosphotransferase